MSASTAPLTEQPKEVGGIPIAFAEYEQYDVVPDFNYDTIYVPVPYEKLDAYPLMKGQQMLLHGGDEGRTFFVGIDDGHGFATELEDEHWYNFSEGDDGETAFYAGLVPPAISDCLKHWGVEAPLRQGDMWAVPIPGDWAAVRGYQETVDNDELEIRDTSDEDLFENDHWLTGQWVDGTYVSLPKSTDWSVTDSFVVDDRGSRPIVCSGKLVASDHPDLVMDGPFVVAQTVGQVDSD